MSVAGRSNTTRFMDLLWAEMNDDDLDRLGELLLPRMQDRIASNTGRADGWLDTRQAADYLGITKAALYRATAERTIAFEQSGPGCKCWFKRPDLDDWRRGQTRDAAKTQPRRSNSTIPALVLRKGKRGLAGISTMGGTGLEPVTSCL